MIYNDIRYVNVAGSQIPVGHPNIVEYNGGPHYNTIVEFFMHMDSEKLGDGGNGVVAVEAVNTVGDAATIVFPIRGHMPYGNNYTCTASAENMYPKKMYRQGDSNTGCRVKIEFNTNVYFHIHSDAPEGLKIELDPTDDWWDKGYTDAYDINNEGTEEMLRKPTVLKADIDYGDSLPATGVAGQIFYVAVD